MAGSDSDNRSTEGDSRGSAEKMWKGPVCSFDQSVVRINFVSEVGPKSHRFLQSFCAGLVYNGGRTASD